MTLFIKAVFVVTPLIALLTGCASDSTVDPTPTDIGTAWRIVESGIANTVSGLAANDTLTVAVGDGGIIYTSTDRRDWTVQREFGPNDGLADIAWFRNRFVAVGYNGVNISSADGMTWTPGDPTGQHMLALGRHDTLLVAVCSQPTVYTSVDGSSFQPGATLGSTPLTEIVRTNLRWLACGDQEVWRSFDGVSWYQQSTTFPPDETLIQVEYSDTLYFLLSHEAAAGRFRLYTSVDADLWQYQSSFEAWSIKDLVWSGTELVAVGDGTNYHAGLPDGVVFSTTDYLTWTEQPSESPFALKTALVLDSALLVAGSGGYVVSGPTAADLEIQTSGADITGVVWDGANYVAVTAQGTVLMSPDGDAWEEHHSSVSNGFERLAYGASLYVTIGGLGVPIDIYTSDDATLWTRTHAYDDVFLKDIIYGGGRFLACGQYGTVYTSPDGNSWSKQFVGDSVTLNCLLWDGSRYLAAATSQIFASNDGTVWTELNLGGTSTPLIARMIWDGINYVAVGNDYSNPALPQGVVSVSANAVDWTLNALGPAEKIFDIGLSGTRFIACGRDGGLWSSSGPSNWQKLTPPTAHDLVDIATTNSRALIVGGRRTVLAAP